MFFKPVVKEVMKHFPEYKHEVSGPYGLGSRMHLSLFKKHRSEFENAEDYYSKDNWLCLVIVPIDPRNGIIHYETGEKKNEYPNNSIGAMNGFNNVTERIVSIKQIVELLKEKQNGQ